MTRARALTTTLGLVATLASMGCQRAPAPHVAATPRRAPLVIAIVVDQLGAWVLEQALPSLSETGGFARLMREGRTTKRMEYAHAVTDTAPGHAALFTGKPPCESGIFVNEVIDGGHATSVLADAAAKTIGVGGGGGRKGASLRRLRVPTVADELRAHAPGATIVALSMKDRGALFGGGRAPSAVLYFDPKTDELVTSSAFASAFPAGLVPPSFSDRRKTPWTLLDPAAHGKSVRLPDDQPGEGAVGGFGVTFPHDFAKASDTALATRASPVGDAVLLDVASQVIAQRDKSQPLLLTLSFSSHDYTSHVFGPESWEERDTLMRLDRGLGALFAQLDREAGIDGWSALLAADHGSLPLPEAPPTSAPTAPYHPPVGPYVRISPDAWERELTDVAEKLMGPGAWIDGVTDPYVMLKDALALPEEQRKKLVSGLMRHLSAQPGVAKVYDLTTAAPCPTGTSAHDLDSLVGRSRLPEPMSALYVVPKPGAFFDPRYVTGRGVSHGSPYLYDRTVPLLVRAPGKVLAGEVEPGPVSFERYAETLRMLLELPSATAARSR